MFQRPVSLSIAIASIGLLAACSPTDSGPSTLDAGLDLFRQNRLEEALPVLQRVVSDREADVDAHIWLAETYRRLRKTDEAIQQARIALDLEPCNTFALVVMADASVPVSGETTLASSGTSWSHLLKAIECDPSDGNVWESLWGFAIRRDEPEMLRESLRRMVSTGFLTDAALDFGRWLLSTLPENAILITNGDMDTYPSMAVQVSEGFRQDVTVVERGLLDLSWGVRFLRDHGGVPIPFSDSEMDSLKPAKDDDGGLILPSDRIFEAWVDASRSGHSVRPVALATTVYRDFFDQVEGDLKYAGPFWLVKAAIDTQVRDTVALRSSLTGIDMGDFEGPWISEQDYSPVRGMYTRNVVKNVTSAALTYAEELIADGRIEEAQRTLDWAEAFEQRTELGPALADRIREIRRTSLSDSS